MAVLYDDISIAPKGILSTHLFRTPVNGRLVIFRLPDGYDQTEIYIRSDNCYIGPYKELSPVATNVRGVEILRRDAHTSTAVAINTTSVDLPRIQLSFSPIIMTLFSGEKVQVRTSGTIDAKIAVLNSHALLQEYDNQRFSSVEEYVTGILRDAFERHCLKVLKKHFSGMLDIQELSLMDSLGDEIRAEAYQEVSENTKSWMKLQGCSFKIVSDNVAELVEKDNYCWRKQEEQASRIFDEELKIRTEAARARIDIERRAAEALLDVYKADPIPKGMPEVLAAYVQRFQDIPPAELINVCREFRKLSEKSSPEMLLSVVKKLTSGQNPL